jgi:GxxExxY protein
MQVREPLTGEVIGCAIEVHRRLGPGLLESAYQRCLAHELSRHHIQFVGQAPLPVEYRDLHLDCGYRIDFLIEGCLVVELKAVERVLPIHHAQILTYLKLLGVKQGLLINFNVTRLTNGLRSFLL